MKYFTFYKEDNNFADILNDTSIKKLIRTKIKWYNYLLIGVDDCKNSSAISLINLKYGDYIVTNLTKDFTPIPGIDYVPKKNKNKFKKAQI